jgi:hypothetical protein
MNCSASVNQACLAANPNGTACMFGANTAPFVQTPLFVLNSKYDTWQAGGIIGAGKCGNNITSCSLPIQKFWAGYGNRMVAILKGLPPQHGGFLSNCQAHCQTGSGGWSSTTVDGTSMGDAFLGWHSSTLAAWDKQERSSGGMSVRVRRTVGNATGHRYYETCDIKQCGTDTCDGHYTTPLYIGRM